MIEIGRDSLQKIPVGCCSRSQRRSARRGWGMSCCGWTAFPDTNNVYGQVTGKCADGKSTHSSKAGYVCDVNGERIMAPAAWYSAYFEKEMGGETAASNVDHGVGFPLPGLRAICENAVKSHESVLKEQPWLQMCGWDAIYAKQGPVFFEGNFAAHRIPRRVFLTWTNTFHFLSTRKAW